MQGYYGNKPYYAYHGSFTSGNNPSNNPHGSSNRQTRSSSRLTELSQTHGGQSSSHHRASSSQHGHSHRSSRQENEHNKHPYYQSEASGSQQGPKASSLYLLDYDYDPDLQVCGTEINLTDAETVEGLIEKLCRGFDQPAYRLRDFWLCLKANTSHGNRSMKPCLKFELRQEVGRRFQGPNPFAVRSIILEPRILDRHDMSQDCDGVKSVRASVVLRLDGWTGPMPEACQNFRLANHFGDYSLGGPVNKPPLSGTTLGQILKFLTQYKFHLFSCSVRRINSEEYYLGFRSWAMQLIYLLHLCGAIRRIDGRIMEAVPALPSEFYVQGLGNIPNPIRLYDDEMAIYDAVNFIYIKVGSVPGVTRAKYSHVEPGLFHNKWEYRKLGRLEFDGKEMKRFGYGLSVI